MLLVRASVIKAATSRNSRGGNQWPAFRHLRYRSISHRLRDERVQPFSRFPVAARGWSFGTSGYGSRCADVSMKGRGMAAA
jgi:hypothetical protein